MHDVPCCSGAPHGFHVSTCPVVGGDFSADPEAELRLAQLERARHGTSLYDRLKRALRREPSNVDFVRATMELGRVGALPGGPQYRGPTDDSMVRARGGAR